MGEFRHHGLRDHLHAQRRQSADARRSPCGASIVGLIASGTTFDVARRRVTNALRDAGLPDAALDARIFLEEVTGRDPGGLLRDGRLPLGEGAAVALDGMVARRLKGEPVWRILGVREFWGLRFTVTPNVLDPRPDTETIVSAALEALGSRRDTRLRILDLGVGSGAILCALLSELPQAQAWGIDRSHAAAAVARKNLTAVGLASRGLILQGDWATAMPDQGFDLVVSNPPYIETAVIPDLDREVRDHDPPLALDGGADGLDCYRIIAADLRRLLHPDGVAVLEVGAGQASAVQALIAAAGLRNDGLRHDLGGHARAVVARR